MRRYSTALLFTFGAAASCMLFLVGCASQDTTASVTQEAPVGASSYSSEGLFGAGAPSPYSPVSPDGTANVSSPQPTPITFGSPAPAAANAPNITAKAAILVDGRGRVLFEKNADTRVATASTQKLLLGIMIVERGNLGGTLTVADSDTWAEPTKMGLKTGQVYTRDELLRAVLIRSCNDIARALARDHSGSESAFAAEMNQRARQLGMTNSYFTNASGLPTPSGQYSTARDLSILGAAALRKPMLRDIVRTKGMTFRFPDGTTKSITTTNQVLRNFPYCTGLKTGYTNAAGRCLVSSASANGKDVIAVILGSTSPAVWSESQALLEYGLGL